MARCPLDINPMAGLVLAIGISVPAIAQDSPPNQQMIELVTQVQQLQDEVRMLRGQLEEQAYEIETLKRRQRDQYLDLDQRIGELAEREPATAVTGPGAAAEPPPVTAPAPREDHPEVREAIDTESSVAALGTPDVESRSAPATAQSEQAAYDAAFQALKELRYADAAEQFRAFIDTYPGSDYADNAQYWLGESYYVTRNYEIALEAFQELIERYPDSVKAGDGLLKIGFTHYELKQWDEARAALEQVQEQYPDTTLARLAESRLRSMRLEGHF